MHDYYSPNAERNSFSKETPRHLDKKNKNRKNISINAKTVSKTELNKEPLNLELPLDYNTMISNLYYIYQDRRIIACLQKFIIYKGKADEIFHNVISN